MQGTIKTVIMTTVHRVAARFFRPPRNLVRMRYPGKTAMPMMMPASMILRNGCSST